MGTSSPPHGSSTPSPLASPPPPTPSDSRTAEHPSALALAAVGLQIIPGESAEHLLQRLLAVQGGRGGLFPPPLVQPSAAATVADPNRILADGAVPGHPVRLQSPVFTPDSTLLHSSLPGSASNGALMQELAPPAAQQAEAAPSNNPAVPQNSAAAAWDNQLQHAKEKALQDVQKSRAAALSLSLRPQGGRSKSKVSLPRRKKHAHKAEQPQQGTSTAQFSPTSVPSRRHSSASLPLRRSTTGGRRSSVARVPASNRAAQLRAAATEAKLQSGRPQQQGMSQPRASSALPGRRGVSAQQADSFYRRNLQWAGQVREACKSQASEREQAAIEECTFAPAVRGPMPIRGPMRVRARSSTRSHVHRVAHGTDKLPSCTSGRTAHSKHHASSQAGSSDALNLSLASVEYSPRELGTRRRRQVAQRNTELEHGSAQTSAYEGIPAVRTRSSTYRDLSVRRTADAAMPPPSPPFVPPRALESSAPSASLQSSTASDQTARDHQQLRVQVASAVHGATSAAQQLESSLRHLRRITVGAPQAQPTASDEGSGAAVVLGSSLGGDGSSSVSLQQRRRAVQLELRRLESR